MLGLLRGRGGGIGCADRSALWAHACATCVSVGKQFGQPLRVATSFDAALLSLLYSAMGGHPGARAQPRVSGAEDAREGAGGDRVGHVCPFRGFRSLDIARPESAGVRFAATANMAAVGAKLRDAAEDGDSALGRVAPRGLRAAAVAIRGGVDRAVDDSWAPLDFDFDEVDRIVATQGEAEVAARALATDGRSEEAFSAASRPTELATATCFAHTHVLASTSVDSSPSDAARALLFAAGEQFGRVMYLLDAVKDRRRDERTGAFNALAVAFPGADVPRIRAEAAALFVSAHGALQGTLRELEPELARGRREDAAAIRALLGKQLLSTARDVIGASAVDAQLPLSVGLRNATDAAAEAGARACATCGRATGVGGALSIDPLHALAPVAAANTWTGGWWAAQRHPRGGVAVTAELREWSLRGWLLGMVAGAGSSQQGGGGTGSPHGGATAPAGGGGGGDGGDGDDIGDGGKGGGPQRKPYRRISVRLRRGDDEPSGASEEDAKADAAAAVRRRTIRLGAAGALDVGIREISAEERAAEDAAKAKAKEEKEAKKKKEKEDNGSSWLDCCDPFCPNCCFDCSSGCCGCGGRGGAAAADGAGGCECCGCDACGCDACSCDCCACSCDCGC